MQKRITQIKICLVNSSFIAKNTPEKYFHTHEAQETNWNSQLGFRKEKFHWTNLIAFYNGEATVVH